MQRPLRPAIALTLAAAAVATTGPATAQTNVERASGLEEIVVTSRRVQETLQDTPLSVSAFRAGDLEKLSLRNIGETSLYTPGFVTAAGPTGQNDGFFFIRGVGQADLNPATDPGVGTYIDGVYLGRIMGASFDVLDIERVEVLRGPQGTLFGRNTMGGAVNVVTRDPDEEFAGEVKVFGGDRSEFGGVLRLSAPLGETTGASVSVMYREQEGYGERVYDDTTLPDVENLAGHLKLVWEPTDALKMTLSADASRLRGTAQHQILLALNPMAVSPLGVPLAPGIAADIPTDIYDNHSSPDPKHDLDAAGGSLTFEWSPGSFTLKSITAYRELEQFATNDFDGSRYTFYDNFFDTDQDQFSQELQLLWDGERFDGLLGAYYYDESAYHNNGISLGGNNGCLPFPPPPGNPYPFCGANPYATPLIDRQIRNNQQFDIDIEAIALFAHLDVELSERWSASVGVRWTDEEKTQAYDFFIDNEAAVANLAGLPPFVLPTLSPRNPFLAIPSTYEESWSEVTPSATLEFRPIDAVLTYFSYARGFKSGGFNGRPTPNQSGQFAAIQPYDPESLDTYELGLKSQFADDRVRLNAAVFYSEYQDIQLLVLGPSGFFETENAAESEIKGLEIELLARPIPAFELQAAIAYNDNEYTELDSGTVATGITQDDVLPLTPEWTYALGAQYTWEFSADSSFSLRADYSWRDDVYYNATNNPFEFQESFGLLSARAVYTFGEGDMHLAAYGRNLTDEEYYSNGQDVLGPLGVAFVGVGAPREYGVEFGWRFGD